ncbi:MAG: nuclear transport factor 2 family protein [Planctomycetota bacterium]|jgi:hypothetical protein
MHRRAPLAALALAACAAPQTASSPLDDATRLLVETEVQASLDDLCADLETRGPIAWIDHFSESPEFHMASDGVLLFQTSLDLRSAMEGFAASVDNLRLRFIDARVLPFDRDRAHIAARFEEDLIYQDGRAEPMAGHFSAVAVREDGDWRLLNAHWSQADD